MRTPEEDTPDKLERYVTDLIFGTIEMIKAGYAVKNFCLINQPQRKTTPIHLAVFAAQTIAMTYAMYLASAKPTDADKLLPKINALLNDIQRQKKTK